MNDIDFINNYLARYNKSLFETDVSKEILSMKEILKCGLQ